MNACFVELGPTDSVYVAARAMKDERVGFVCVCDTNRRPLGIITDRDLAMRVCAEELPVRETKLEEVMTRRPLVCRLDTAASEVEALMSNNGVAKILVVDEEGRLAGTLTIAEIWHYESPLTAANVSRRVTERQLRQQTGSSGQRVSRVPGRFPAS